MDIPEAERIRNDMMKTGRFCPTCQASDSVNEMEQVSARDMYVCHWCGGQFRINEKGEIIEVQFKGVE